MVARGVKLTVSVTPPFCTVIGGWMMQIIYLIIEIIIVAWPALLVLAAGFILFKITKGRRKLIRLPALAVLIFGVLWIAGIAGKNVLLSMAHLCPTGSCPERDPMHVEMCKFEVAKTLNCYTSLSQRPKDLYHSNFVSSFLKLGDREDWEVAVHCKPKPEQVVIPINLKLKRDEYMHGLKYLYRKCAYEVTCRVFKEGDGEWQTYLMALNIDEPPSSFVRFGKDYCKELEIESIQREIQ